MLAETIKNKYPKAYNALVKYTENLLQSIPGSQEAIKLIMTDSIVKGIIENQPRTLYDFLDRYNIFISLYRNEKSWSYSITDSTYDTKYDTVLSDRKEVEDIAFTRAFSELDKLL